MKFFCQFLDVIIKMVSFLHAAYEYEVPEENYNLPYHQTNNVVPGEAVTVKIDVPVPLREEPKFPKEKWKTFVSFLILAANFILATVSLSLVHERLPDREVYHPLPDIVLDNITPQEWALNVSEVLIMIVVNSCILLIIFHKHRFIVMRRVFLIMAVLYFMRSITMYVTVLPVSSTTYYCSPKANSTTPLVIAKRVFQLISGFGLSINGKHTYCGDSIYSGHTVMLVLGYLVIAEYSPRRFYLLHWTAWATALAGVIFVLIAHGHYTIDVIIAYYVTTRLFWTYHTLANNHFLLKKRRTLREWPLLMCSTIVQSGSNNYIGREWWYTYFKYFEKNVRGPVPRQYEWPLPWPRQFHSKLPNRES
ncbi:phosphatidylcholine:ceramide cholinephosphotransferase 1-like isoform X3 [Hermetia illucens]|uniref:phosphatidylcholine:ceramide cholinephosphotransferase 1-like isoform X3 n=1 Tax=Hermetia illucens TaxID=343691 RepID=UPI0018CBF5BB|nr:phosphatidylcholine:ceramide cholinephosphotransferase 1-like isoform X3 [Hermetia illucens]